ncbi:3-hydroxyacyl-ACP dehydratase FabZ family protein [Rhizosphaericola mali]|uniref:Hydroxymyristoyl-ACP dehydratase n=1 Tax=Rhizosphaericola mali TaxID=2545455 RepID=A0A5P2G7M2_9BACT|nr:hydroxymyristoyl-ACP dehydratase [Rhizosphaericola mali]QES90279.1 hydroxymyristoyl-ACP dehydratase [Rhizosphaericola mali]
MNLDRQITTTDILSYFPIQPPFRFINTIDEVNAQQIIGSYTFSEDEYFFKGHFPNNPIVPGSILQESAAQIGLVAFGMYLLGNRIDSLFDIDNTQLPNELAIVPGIVIENYVIRFYLTSSELKFKKIVQPSDTIHVHAEKIFFRLNKLKCGIEIKNEADQIICKGIMSGMVHVSILK